MYYHVIDLGIETSPLVNLPLFHCNILVLSERRDIFLSKVSTKRLKCRPRIPGVFHNKNHFCTKRRPFFAQSSNTDK